MKTYENSHFYLRLDIPDTWKLTSWRLTDIASSWQSAYQTRDDDLPNAGKGASKFLFTAALQSSESKGLLDADIELSVFRLCPGENMRDSLVENFRRQGAYYESNGIEGCSIKEGVWALGNMDFTYIDQESKTRDGYSRYRFFFRPVNEALWLYGKVAGHTPRAYEEALRIMEGLKSTAETIG